MDIIPKKLISGNDIIPKALNQNTIKLDADKYYIEDLNENYIEKLFEDILKNAVKSNSSDIHIEPFRDYFIIRNRIDGELKEVSRKNISLYLPFITVIKLKSNIDITERRLPQDGRVDLEVNDNIIDLRVSTIPTIYGEKIVLRILNRSSFLKSKKELGFSEKAISKIDNMINKKSGILIVTGPTGSGKTTTVYSILNELKNTRKNIMTIEDPVEYKLDGINQIQVNTKIGLTFEVGLRSILRQDPDIIMIGEIRDVETAKIAIRAAITGHLVISTMHTNDAISSISRLIEMKIPPYLINASLNGIISQRLVRKLCSICSHDITISDNDGKEISTRVALGCKECNDGYYGRVPIYEVLEITDDIRDEIIKMSNIKNIREIALEGNMITFDDTYKNLVDEKVISLEEYLISSI